MKSNGPDILSHLFLLSYVALFFSQFLELLLMIQLHNTKFLACRKEEKVDIKSEVVGVKDHAYGSISGPR